MAEKTEKKMSNEQMSETLNMFLDVKKLVFGAQIGIKDSYDFQSESPFVIDSENDIVMFKGNVKLTRLPEELMAEYKIEYLANTQCARCLKRFERKGARQFTREYLIEGVDPEGEKLSVNKNYQIDIGLPIYEELIFDIPMKPLCDKDCKGVSVRKK